MKKTIYTALKILPVLTAILIGSSSGCSYVMDAIEGKLRNRAAFSIDASYDSTTKKVTISWDESGSDPDGCFPGYEIYISSEKDDEYVGYILAVSPFEYESNLIETPGIDDDGDLVFTSDLSTLENPSTSSFVMDVSPLINSSSIQYGPGKYFFRVGIIKWDRSKLDDRIDKYIGGANYCNITNKEANYYIHTNIDDPSGYAMLDLQ